MVVQKPQNISFLLRWFGRLNADHIEIIVWIIVAFSWKKNWHYNLERFGVCLWLAQAQQIGLAVDLVCGRFSELR